MKNLVAFFEIPAANFNRAVDFYQSVFDVRLSIMDCETEKMAFFPQIGGKCPGAISYAEGFDPSKDGVLISLHVENMEEALRRIEVFGGKVTRNKTKIEADDMGYFSLFIDSEGNRLGLYSDK